MSDLLVQHVGALRGTPHQPRKGGAQQSRAEFAPGVGGGAPVGRASSLSAPPPLSPEVLINAQQARLHDKVRAVDLQGAYGGKPRQATPFIDENEQRDAPDADAGPSPEITDSDVGAPNRWGTNVVPVYGGPQGDFNDGALGDGPPNDRTHQAANRAYVRAGAADGEVFTTTGTDTAIPPRALGFDIVV